MNLTTQLNYLIVLLIISAFSSLGVFIILCHKKFVLKINTIPLPETTSSINSPFIENKFPITKSPKTLINHQIIKSDGTHVGWRQAFHSDINEALKTPGLAVKYPDSRIDLGVQ